MEDLFSHPFLWREVAHYRIGGSFNYVETRGILCVQDRGSESYHLEI